MADRTCVTCGTTFSQRYVMGQPPKYCSKACKPKPVQRPTMPCRICKKLMWKDKRGKVEGEATCDPCRLMMNPAGWFYVDRTCATCCRGFTPRKYEQQYCSTKCSQWWRRYDPKARASANYSNVVRHRKTKGADVERIDTLTIFVRDGWRCQLCGVKVLRHSDRYNPHKPTLDHIIPLSLGGSHTAANVQLACLRCNTRKGNRVLGPGEQLRLIG